MSEREQLERAIAALEAQRAALGDAVVDPMIAAAQEKLAALEGAVPAAAPAAEQRKQVTVLFADIFGFTKLAEQMDPEELHDVVNALWERLDALIVAHGGTIDKHMGDAVMALWGAELAQEDDPERAIRAALAIQSEVGSWGREVDFPAAAGFQLRIGTHTGAVLLGQVGLRGEYTAIGDTVNLANRLQQAAPVGGILISHDTYRHVRGLFDVRPLDPLDIRGRREPVQVYLVQASKPRVFHIARRGVEGIDTEMVGRGAELRQLQEALGVVLEQGRMQAVTIVGEAGVGKSRLLNEFNDWLELLPLYVRLFKGRTDPQMSQRPYDLIRDLFAFRFEIQETDPAAVAREKLEQGIVAFMGPAGVEKAHFIGHLIGFDFSASPHLQGILDDARQIRDRALHYLTQLFAAASSERPTVLFVEDIHWADRGALDVLEHLMRTCADMRVLVVCLARPSLYEVRPGWCQELAHHLWLELSPLSDDDSNRLVEEILRRAPEVPPDLKALVVSRAEGNPFYIEELIKVLIEDGVIVKGEGAWQVRASRLAEVRVPQTLTGVLQARLDRLPTPEQELLQCASVVGRAFWDGAVAYIAQAPLETVQETLRRLEEKELVQSRRASTFAGQREWIFRHALLREVIYERVLKRRRRTYHNQVAAWLIEQSGERVGEHAGLIGSHYEQAGEMALVSEWYKRAGRQAQDAYAPEAAIDYYQKALVFLPVVAGDPTGSAARRTILYEGLGDALGRLGRYGEAIAAYGAMRETAEAARDALGQARAWEHLAWVQSNQGDYRATLESAEKAVGWAGVAEAPIELVKALHRKGWAFYGLGNAEAARALGEQALTISTAAKARREMAQSLNLLGAVYWILGHHEQAAQHMERALQLHRELGNRPGVGGTLNDLAATAQLCGDYPRALLLYQDALVTFREIGYRWGEVACLSNLGGVRVALGEYGTAEEDLRQVLRTAEAGSWFLAETYRFLAEACLGQGKEEEALAAARHSLALARESEQQEFIGGAWRVLGLVAARRSEPVPVGDGPSIVRYTAAECFQESLRVFGEMGAERERALTLRAWAQQELERGDPARGEAMEREAAEILQRLRMVPEAE